MFCLKAIQLTRDLEPIDDIESPRHGHEKKRKERKTTKARLRRVRDLMAHNPRPAEGTDSGEKGQRMVLTEYLSSARSLVLVFNSGLVCWLLLDLSSDPRVDQVLFDHYLEGKLLSHHIVDVVWKELEAPRSVTSSSPATGPVSALFVSYTEARVTGVFFSSPDPRNPVKGLKLKHRHGLKVVELNLVEESSTTRRAERHLLVNNEPDSLPLLLIWWQIGPHSVSPWSAPIRSQRDLANILVYNYTESHFEFVAFGSVANQIVKIEFSKFRSNQIIVIESGDSVTSLTYSLLEIRTGGDGVDSLKRVYSMAITLISPWIQVALNCYQEKVLILCEDKTVTMFNTNENVVQCLRASLDAERIVSHPLDGLFLICDRFGHILMYDYALSVIPANYDDLGIADLDLISVDEVKCLTENIVCLRYSGDTGSGDLMLVTLPRGVDVLTLIGEYLKNDYTNEAIGNLLALNWNSDSCLTYNCLCLIFSHLLSKSLNAIRESQLETTLGAFFRPSHAMEESVENEYRLGMYFLAKRFFYHLLRYNCLEKAFLLSIDLKSRQLFILLHKVATERGNHRLAEVTLSKANKLLEHRQRHQRKNQGLERDSNGVVDLDRDGQASTTSHSLPSPPPPPLPLLPPPALGSYSPLLIPLGSNNYNTNESNNNFFQVVERSSLSESPPIPAPRKLVTFKPTTTTFESHPEAPDESYSPPNLMPLCVDAEIRIPLESRSRKPIDILSQSHMYDQLAVMTPPPALPPRKVINRPEPPPPLPPKTFLQKPAIRGFFSAPRQEAADEKTPVSWGTTGSVQPLSPKSLLQIKSSIPSSCSSSSPSSSSPSSLSSSSCFSSSSYNLPDSRDVQVNGALVKPVKPKIECVHFGVV